MNDERKFSAPTQSAHGTPPERQFLLPLTPPATDEWPSTTSPQSPVSAVLDLIKQRQLHKVTGQSRQLKLQSLEYRNLLARLEEHPELRGFIDDKLRLEYDPLEEVLCLRMPTTRHESFSEQVSQATKAQLERIASGNDEAAKFAAQISCVRSGSIQLREFDSDDSIESDHPYIQRQPDEQFQHEEAEYPGVVYEIACSQDGRDLDKAAWTYIPYSNGNIKAVVGFELGYGKNKEARLSVWQPRYLREGEQVLEILDVETVVDRDPFRSSDGSATNITKTLHIPLDRFATSEVATLKSEGLLGITIPYTCLAQYLNKAERLEGMRQPLLGEEGTGKKSTRPTRKRRRPHTPPEQLSSDREKEFRNAESRAAGRAEVEDGDFPNQTRAGMEIPNRRKSRRTK
ncbi:MAG: hypothetical protein M1818_006401 [Claussenomyces sp. TS43310]|nr:MAG: hypothetical protein M1818_006401 [Claussenomyces sp. TS43310]